MDSPNSVGGVVSLGLRSGGGTGGGSESGGGGGGGRLTRSNSFASTSAAAGGGGPPPPPRDPASNVQVAVRVRPRAGREVELGVQEVVSARGPPGAVVLTDPTAFLAAEEARRAGRALDLAAFQRPFAFDHVFEAGAPQARVYERLGLAVLQSAWEGYNCSVFAYGQTGAGKSYTMMGSGMALDDRVATEDYGLIPRLCCGLFAAVGEAQEEQRRRAAGAQRAAAAGEEEAEAAPAVHYSVEVSYLEIYNEVVRDLFVPKGKPLKVREHPTKGAYVEGLSRVPAASYQEVGQLIAYGGRARTVAATNMNQYSSRSHAIFTVHFRQTRVDLATGAATEKGSRIHLVDLAGSERVTLTGSTGDRLREANNINKSLATLSDVIKALSGRRKKKAAPGAAAERFIPYRNSVLTWLLKESLGGNARTLMLAAVSPGDVHFEETLSTLRYAERAKRVRTNAVVNQDSSAAMIDQLKAEIALLRAQLADRKEGGGGAIPAAAGGFSPFPGGGGGGENGAGAGGPLDEALVMEMGAQLQALQRQLQEKERVIQMLLTQPEVVAAAAAAASPGGAAPAPAQGGERGGGGGGGDGGGGSGGGGGGEGGQLLGTGDAALALGGGGPALDDWTPRMVNLNQDPFFSECLVYPLREGVSVVGAGEGATHRLQGDDLADKHAVVSYAAGALVLCPLGPDCACFVDGRRVPWDHAAGRAAPAALGHGSRVVFGRRHFFRIELPGAAAAAAPPKATWESAHRELVESGEYDEEGRGSAGSAPSPSAASVGAVSSLSQLQSLEDKVRWLEAERQDYRLELEARARELSGAASGGGGGGAAVPPEGRFRPFLLARGSDSEGSSSAAASRGGGRAAERLRRQGPGALNNGGGGGGGGGYFHRGPAPPLLGEDESDASSLAPYRDPRLPPPSGSPRRRPPRRQPSHGGGGGRRGHLHMKPAPQTAGGSGGGGGGGHDPDGGAAWPAGGLGGGAASTASLGSYSSNVSRRVSFSSLRAAAAVDGPQPTPSSPPRPQDPPRRPSDHHLASPHNTTPSRSSARRTEGGGHSPSVSVSDISLNSGAFLRASLQSANGADDQDGITEMAALFDKLTNARAKMDELEREMAGIARVVHSDHEGSGVSVRGASAGGQPGQGPPPLQPAPTPPGGPAIVRQSSRDAAPAPDNYFLSAAMAHERGPRERSGAAAAAAAGGWGTDDGGGDGAPGPGPWGAAAKEEEGEGRGRRDGDGRREEEHHRERLAAARARSAQRRRARSSGVLAAEARRQRQQALAGLGLLLQDDGERQGLPPPPPPQQQHP